MRQVIGIETLAAAYSPISVLRGVNAYAAHRFEELGLRKGYMRSYRENYGGIELICLEWDGFEDE